MVEKDEFSNSIRNKKRLVLLISFDESPLLETCKDLLNRPRKINLGLVYSGLNDPLRFCVVLRYHLSLNSGYSEVYSKELGSIHGEICDAGFLGGESKFQGVP